MSESPNLFTPGSVHPLSKSGKKQWELGQVRQIAAGTLDGNGLLAPCLPSEWSWQLSIRSIEKSGTFDTGGNQQFITLIAGDFIQLAVDGDVFGVEPLRPLKFSARSPVATSQPAEELLVLHLASRLAVRATVRIVELSKKREQHLFDGQLGILLQGAATMSAQTGESKLQLRDTIIGGDEAEVRLSGRGFLAVISLDLAQA